MLVVFYCLVQAFLIGAIDASSLSSNRNACPVIKLQNGRVRYRQRGRFVKFICTTGYIIAGEKYSTCIQGKWDTPIPRCVRPTCSKVLPPMNGLIYPSHRGAVLNFFCKSGYIMKGSDVIYCDGKRWDSNKPNCIENGTKPLTDCSFETDDLCGWNHDVNHDFDWKRQNFRTPSGHIGTGPSFDHTKGEDADGYYMYIESSSRNENDTARLISPIYNSTQTDTCFEFFYHMYGHTTGHLRAYLKKVSEPWDLSGSKMFFSKNGNQGNKWYRSVHHLGAINEDFQIVIEGIRGSSYISDIAIDDVNLIDDCIIEDEFDTTTESSPYTGMDEVNYDSCLNRCDAYNDSDVNHHFNCACDESCYVGNRCCPDYVTMCILGPTDDLVSIGTTDLMNEVEVEETTIIRRNKPPTITTTIKPTKIFINNSMPPPIIILKPNATYIIKKNKTESTVTIKSTVPIRTKTTNKIITTPATTMVTTKMATKISKTTAAINVSKRTKKVPKKWPTVKFENDVLPVPAKTAEPDEKSTPIVVPTAPMTVYIKKVVDELEMRFPVGAGGVKQKITVERPGNNQRLYVIAIGGVAIALLVVLGVTCYVRRYSVINCVRMRKMKSSSNGHSQSDVRFLASDEQLDFTWAKPSDYYD